MHIFTSSSTTPLLPMSYLIRDHPRTVRLSDAEKQRGFATAAAQREKWMILSEIQREIAYEMVK